MPTVEELKDVPAKWSIKRWSWRGRKGFWWEWWTPVWHNGRGPYISIGLGVIAIYRGY